VTHAQLSAAVSLARSDWIEADPQGWACAHVPCDPALQLLRALGKPPMSAVQAADTGAADTGIMDTGAVDTGAADTGSMETGAVDTGAADTGAVDTGAADRAADTGDADTRADTGIMDTGADTGSVDTGAADTGIMDNGSDTGIMDTGAADTGAVDTPTAALSHVRRLYLQTELSEDAARLLLDSLCTRAHAAASVATNSRSGGVLEIGGNISKIALQFLTAPGSSSALKAISFASGIGLGATQVPTPLQPTASGVAAFPSWTPAPPALHPSGEKSGNFEKGAKLGSGKIAALRSRLGAAAAHAVEAPRQEGVGHMLEGRVATGPVRRKV